MNDMIIEIKGLNEQSEVSKNIEKELLASLANTNEQSTNQSVVLAKYDLENKLIAGLTASTSYGWLLIKTLWVADFAREQGIGRMLVKRAETEAQHYGCHSAWLDTSNADARLFYQKLGYSDFGILENVPTHFPPTHKRWFMKKSFE